MKENNEVLEAQKGHGEEAKNILDKRSKFMDFSASSTLIIDPTKSQETEPEEMKKEEEPSQQSSKASKNKRKREKAKEKKNIANQCISL